MIKLIFIIVAVWFFWFIIRQTKAKMQRKNKIKNKEIVACRICGVYVPSTQALTKDQHFYCSIEHLKQTEKP